MEKRWTNSVKYKSQGGKGYLATSKKEERPTTVDASCVRTFLLKHIIEGKIEGINDGKTRKKT
jgi:hypothetical protein